MQVYMLMFMQVYIFMRVNTCRHVWSCAYTHTHLHMQLYRFMFVKVYMFMCVCPCNCVCSCLYMYMGVWVFMCSSVWDAHVCRGQRPAWGVVSQKISILLFWLRVSCDDWAKLCSQWVPRIPVSLVLLSKSVSLYPAGFYILFYEYKYILFMS